MSRRRKEQGYTLTELLVVLMILGLLTSVGPPALARLWPKAMIDTAKIQIETDISSMRRQSMSTGEIYEFVIYGDNAQYMIQKNDAVFLNRKLQNGLKLSVCENETERSDEKQTVFQVLPNGSLQGPGLRIEWKSQSYALNVQPITNKLTWSNEHSGR